jgi:hypothetical protein
VPYFVRRYDVKLHSHLYLTIYPMHPMSDRGKSQHKECKLLSNTKLNGKANPLAAERHCVSMSPASVGCIVRNYTFDEGIGRFTRHAMRINCDGDEVFASCMARLLMLILHIDRMVNLILPCFLQLFQVGTQAE